MGCYGFWKILLMPLLASCTMGPKYVQPDLDIPCDWHSETSEGMSDESPDCIVWWESFNDPMLNCLIQRASTQNLDLFIAGTRILEARLGRRAAEAEKYPHVDASMTTGHLYWGKDIQKNLFGGSCARHKHHCKRNVNFFEFGFDADWEIDLFGYRKHEENGAQARLEAANAGLSDVWVTLSAEIARNYIELRGFQAKKTLLIESIAAQNESVKLTQELLEIGTASSVDVLQAQEQSALLLAQRPQLDLGIERAIHRLSILLGNNPGDLYAELIEPHALPQMPFQKPLGVPSELLRRRPDIQRAERNLAAATESVGSAVAALFPRFSIFGFVGEISTKLKSMANGHGAAWLIAPQLLFPVFNSRLLKQDVELNQIQTRQALFEYQKTVLSSLEEVENSLTAFRYETERSEHLRQALEIDRQASQLVLELYRKGLKDYLAVLIANRTMLSVEESYLQSHVDLLLNFVSLYKSLGGGWKMDDLGY